MKYLLYALLVAYLAFACQSNATETAEETVVETPQTETSEPPQKETPPNELTFLETAIGTIPVHSSFEGVEPLFNKNNDTTYVINFWATWCKPCVEELPYFEKIASSYNNEKVQVILVSLDFKRQLETKLKDFLAANQLKSQVVVLTDSKYNNWIDKVNEDWGGAIPVTMIYNAEKRTFFGDQFSDFEELETALKDFI